MESQTNYSSSSSPSSSLLSSMALSSSDPLYTLIKVDDDCASEKYDVFLSFRGEDTRKNILGHLRAAFSEKGLKAFVDDDRLARGRNISTQLLKAIENSSCSIVVISPNYASSSWCLDELVHIMYCMKTRAHIVISIFYHIDPSDVRKQTGSFGEAFVTYEKNFEDDLERVNKWRVALTEVTSLAGLDLKNYR